MVPCLRLPPRHMCRPCTAPRPGYCKRSRRRGPSPPRKSLSRPSPHRFLLGGSRPEPLGTPPPRTNLPPGSFCSNKTARRPIRLTWGLRTDSLRPRRSTALCPLRQARSQRETCSSCKTPRTFCRSWSHCRPRRTDNGSRCPPRLHTSRARCTSPSPLHRRKGCGRREDRSTGIRKRTSSPSGVRRRPGIARCTAHEHRTVPRRTHLFRSWSR